WDRMGVGPAQPGEGPSGRPGDEEPGHTRYGAARGGAPGRRRPGGLGNRTGLAPYRGHPDRYHREQWEDHHRHGGPPPDRWRGPRGTGRAMYWRSLVSNWTGSWISNRTLRASPT